MKSAASIHTKGFHYLSVCGSVLEAPQVSEWVGWLRNRIGHGFAIGYLNID